MMPLVLCAGTFFEFVWKNVKQLFKTMFPYRVKYNESEYDIQNNDLLYKIEQKCQNTFEMLQTWKFSKSKQTNHILILLFI